MPVTNSDIFPELNRQEIHVWWCCHDVQVTEDHWKMLDVEEQIRANRFKREGDRNRYVMVRSTLRRLISGYLGITATDLKFCYGCKGKPTLDVAHHDAELEFNVSHSHNFVLWGFSRHLALGVDVEYIQPDFQAKRIAERFFTAQEFQAFQARPRSEQQTFFYQLWTRKEASIKAKGDSLFEQIGQLEVPHHDQCTTQWSSLAHSSLRVRDLDLHQDYTAAIATFSEDPQLSCFEVSSMEGLTG